MLKQSLLAAVVFAAASGAAFADDADPTGQFAMQIQGTRTRAEVHAEAVAAIAAGGLRPSNPHPSAYVQPVLKSTTTRAQVVAEFLADRDEAIAMTREDSGAEYLARVTPSQADRQYLAAR